MGLHATENALGVLEEANLLQLHNTYIIAPASSGFIMVHQQLAHERILYEKYQQASAHPAPTQKSLFPSVLELSAPDAALLEELIPELQYIGYEIESFGPNSFVIQGIPGDVEAGNEKNAIELLLEQFKHFNTDLKFSKREKLIRCLSRQMAIKTGKQLTQIEMRSLINDLLTCTTPQITATGAPTYISFKEDYLDSLFTK
jgi:DNA mismatch repair protein MutL